MPSTAAAGRASTGRLAREQGDERLIVAGGLTAENVGDAIGATGPYAVDVASGTESRPGIKDPGEARGVLRGGAVDGRFSGATP